MGFSFVGGSSQWLGFPARSRPARDLASLFRSLPMSPSLWLPPRRCGWLFLFMCFLGCRSTGFGASSSSTCLFGGLFVVVRLFSAVGTAAGGRLAPFWRPWPWVFLILGARSAAYGTSPPHTALSNGFSGIFRFFLWSFRLVSCRSG